MFGRPLRAYTHPARPVPPGSRRSLYAAIILCGALLAGCGQEKPVVTSAPQVNITTDDLVGKWGLASYRADADRARTEIAARAACSNAYVVTKGPTGGVMMHLADQAVPQEVFLKPGSDGSVYIGPQGKPGDRGDRQVFSYDKGVMIAQWVDPDVAKRYGTMLFTHCGAAAS